MSLAGAPVTRFLLVTLVGGSIAASLLDAKHYLYIVLDLHIIRYRQFWRLLAFQLSYSNSAEVLFGAITLYNLRVIERFWGPRKYASFVVVSYLTSALVVPIISLALRPLSGGLLNYIPAGPTPIIFAGLLQYQAMIPHLYKYRIATGSGATPSSSSSTSEGDGWTLSDKSLRYAAAVHLALLQWPGSVLAAVVGWVTGYAWREGVLPAGVVSWRLPGWLIGEGGSGSARRAREFEGLRRRLEGEPATGTATATDAQRENQPERRRNMGQQIMDQFREAL